MRLRENRFCGKNHSSSLRVSLTSKMCFTNFCLLVLKSSYKMCNRDIENFKVYLVTNLLKNWIFLDIALIGFWKLSCEQTCSLSWTRSKLSPSKKGSLFLKIRSVLVFSFADFDDGSHCRYLAEIKASLKKQLPYTM